MYWRWYLFDVLEMVSIWCTGVGWIWGTEGGLNMIYWMCNESDVLEAGWILCTTEGWWNVWILCHRASARVTVCVKGAGQPKPSPAPPWVPKRPAVFKDPVAMREHVPKYLLLILDMILHSPAVNRVRTLYFKLVHLVVIIFLSDTVLYFLYS